MPKKAKTVTVRIRARQRVSYDRTIELSAEDWLAFKSKPQVHAEMALSVHDIDDGEEFEDVFAAVIDKNGKDTKDCVEM